MYTILYPINELKIGGAEQQLFELVRGIDKERFRVIVAPLYPGGVLDAEFRSVPGVDVIDMNRRSKFDPLPLVRIASLLRRYHVDIVQPFLSPSTFFGLLPALLSCTPVKIVTERCGARKDRGLGYRAYRTVEDRLSHYSDAIVPNSVAGQEMLEERGLPKHLIRVIYNGINLDRLTVESEVVSGHRQRLDAGRDATVVGILASLTRPKGHDVLLRAIAELSTRFPALRAAIIGDGPLRAELETLAAELGIRDQVVFFGYQRDVAGYLAACDILVSASRDNEGCSNSILEAMALKVPVIATDIGGNRELVKQGTTGYLVPAGDHDALAAAMARVISRPDEARSITEQAAEMVATTFGLRRMVRDYEHLYVELLASRVGAPSPLPTAPAHESTERYGHMHGE